MTFLFLFFITYSSLLLVHLEMLMNLEDEGEIHVLPVT